MKAIYTLCLAGMAVAACKSPEPQKTAKLTAASTQTESAIQPIKGLEIAPRIFSVSGKEASEIKLPNGGSIEFPANAFVDVNGKPIDGKVDIRWKEFHSLTDILLSGIPMKYDSLGVEQDFVSGGMFEIKATANAQEVNLAPGKNATVNLASIDDTPCYNFYKLDEKSGKWTYETTKAGTPMPKEKVPGANAPASAGQKADEKKDFIIDAQVNTDACPELKSQSIVGWRALDPVSAKDQKLLSRSESVSVLQPSEMEGEYLLNVTLKQTRRSYRVKPYLLSEAKLATKKNDVQLEKDYAEILAFQANVNAGKIVRSIEIDNFGTYNWDCMSSRTGLNYVVSDFTIPGNVNPKMTSIFYIAPDRNIIIRCTPENGVVYFDPKERCGIIAIRPDNSVVSCGKEEFVKAEKLEKGAKFNFRLKETGITLKSGEDIANYLKELV